MRFREIAEATPQKPLTPKQATKRAQRIAKANHNLADTKAASAIKIRAAQRKINDI